MSTLQQRRHSKIEDSLVRAHEQRDLAIGRLVRAEARLRGLLKTKGRLEKTLAKKLTVSPVPVSVTKGELLPKPTVEPIPEPNDPIPAFLKRRQAKAKADDKLAAQPLTGKAALAAIKRKK